MHVHFKAKQLNIFGIMYKIVNVIMNLNHSQWIFISQKVALMIIKLCSCSTYNQLHHYAWFPLNYI